jgi:hypothetical protein
VDLVETYSLFAILAKFMRMLMSLEVKQMYENNLSDGMASLSNLNICGANYDHVAEEDDLKANAYLKAMTGVCDKVGFYGLLREDLASRRCVDESVVLSRLRGLERRLEINIRNISRSLTIKRILVA